MRNVEKTIISQYDQSQTIRALIDFWNQNLSVDDLLSEIVATCLNIETARGFGLDIIGRIVGIERTLVLSGEQQYFGFNQGEVWQPFNQAPFYRGQPTGSAYRPSDDVYRRMIKAKALINISRMTVPSVNFILMTLFSGRGNVYVVENAAMDWTCKFEFALTGIDRAILNSAALPQPASTTITIEEPA